MTDTEGDLGRRLRSMDWTPEELRAYMNQHRWSISRLYKAAGCGQTTLKQYLRGDRRIPAVFVRAVKHATTTTAIEKRNGDNAMTGVALTTRNVGEARPDSPANFDWSVDR